MVRHTVIENWYSVKELEYDDFVQMPPADSLQANQLAFYSYKLCRKTSEQDGFNLSVGGAQILWEAVCAWKKGFESIQAALDW